MSGRCAAGYIRGIVVAIIVVGFSRAFLDPSFSSVVAIGARPSIASLSVTTGSVAGGTNLTVTGTNFAAGATITFGSASATAITVVSATQITARTLAHAAGVVTVTVTNPDTLSAILTNGFTYTASSLSPPPATITEFSADLTANSHPFGITAGPDGNLWFTENLGNKIGRITPAGTITEFSSVFAPFSGLNGITAGPDGNLWFTEVLANKVGRITPAGTITEFSTGLTANSTPLGITAGPDGNLWFTETSANKIGQITPTGTITEFSTGLTASSNLNVITAGPDGNLWFIESNVNKIGQITSTGTITEFSMGITPNSTPVGITAGPDGNLWFVEGGASKIGQITTAGVISEFSAGLAANSNPNAITTGPDGNLWFTENGANKIGLLPMPSPVVTNISPAAGPPAGGTRVTITGTGFVAGTTVAFGGIAGTNVVVISATQITVVTPLNQPAATVDVVVTNPDGRSGTLHDFTYGTPWPLPNADPTGGTPGAPCAYTRITIGGNNGRVPQPIAAHTPVNMYGGFHLESPRTLHSQVVVQSSTATGVSSNSLAPSLTRSAAVSASGGRLRVIFRYDSANATPNFLPTSAVHFRTNCSTSLMSNWLLCSASAAIFVSIASETSTNVVPPPHSSIQSSLILCGSHPSASSSG